MVEDNTVIEGEFQDERYFGHRLPEIREWLKVDRVSFPSDTCIINFRGGEYVGIDDLFLSRQYWDKAIKMMQEKYPNIEFIVHTDDHITAKRFFPDYLILEDMETNWKAIRYAKHLILSNSSLVMYLKRFAFV